MQSNKKIRQILTHFPSHVVHATIFRLGFPHQVAFQTQSILAAALDWRCRKVGWFLNRWSEDSRICARQSSPTLDPACTWKCHQYEAVVPEEPSVQGLHAMKCEWSCGRSHKPCDIEGRNALGTKICKKFAGTLSNSCTNRFHSVELQRDQSQQYCRGKCYSLTNKGVYTIRIQKTWKT